MVNGNLYVIDAHCHVYPDKIAKLASGNTDRFYDTVSRHDGKVGTLLDLKDKSGIDHFLVQSVATTPKQVQKINQFIADTVRQNNSFMTGLGTLHPDSTDLRADVMQIKQLGLHGVKLHPDIQQFKIDDYRCLKIYELCEQENLPILMHTGDSRYDFSNPNRLLPVIKIFDKLTLVAAHLGGYSVWDEAVEKLQGIDNLYFDCSSSFLWLKKRAKEIIKTYGTDRVLFGSDYPMWSPKEELDTLLSLGFNDDELKMILSENAKKVYNI